MNVLAIDTSGYGLSLAVSRGGKVLAKSHGRLDGVLSETIIRAVDQTLKKAGLTLPKIDGFAVGLGPGSFTSLRVGLATAKAFCLALKKPIVGLASLDIIAYGCAFKGAARDICVLVDAKRQMVYGAIYRPQGSKLKRRTKYLLAKVEDLLPHVNKPTIFTGDGLVLYRSVVEKHMRSRGLEAVFASERDWSPRADVLVSLALERFRTQKTDDDKRIVPLYLYPEDCQVVR